MLCFRLIWGEHHAPKSAKPSSAYQVEVPLRNDGGRRVSPSDPAAQWTGAHKGHAFFAHATYYLIDTENAVILDVEASRASRQAEVSASRTMIDRTARRFGIKPAPCVSIGVQADLKDIGR